MSKCAPIINSEPTCDLVADIMFGAVSLIGPDYAGRVREHVEMSVNHRRTSLDAGQCLAFAAALTEAGRRLLFEG